MGRGLRGQRTSTSSDREDLDDDRAYDLLQCRWQLLRADAVVMKADTLMLTIPSQLGVVLNLRILQNFAEHVAPALDWEPASR
ncbi:hypothetical protein IM764_01125 [Corynebacterium sp. ED61]|nr:hypothetical protein [Corynebacterium sp. ED61]